MFAVSIAIAPAAVEPLPGLTKLFKETLQTGAVNFPEKWSPAGNVASTLPTIIEPSTMSYVTIPLCAVSEVVVTQLAS
jgi:hypothetical protein